MKFRTPTDFRKSLESRLQNISRKLGKDLQSLRRKVAFERFLARIFANENTKFYLKGGYAMELRVANARVTKDIDLTCLQRLINENDVLNEIILDDLQELARVDLNDYFSFQIGKPQLNFNNSPYGGSRFSVSAIIDGKIFVQFQLDVGADIIVDKIENIKGVDWLDVYGFKTSSYPTISIEQQLAEKIHAYSLPRDERLNSRVKDLVDMILLLNIRHIDRKEFQKILETVFKTRNTHTLPKTLGDPPSEWERPFLEIAEECGIREDMKKCFEKISLFYTPIKEEEWLNANRILSKFGNQVEPYTILVAFDEKGSYGTAILIEYKNNKLILTANHVARQLKKAKRIHIILRFDDLRREYPFHDTRDFDVIEWDTNFNDEMLQNVLTNKPKDLAIIIPSPQIMNMLENYKQFYLIREKNIKSDDVLFSFGGIGSEISNNKTLIGSVFSLGIVMDTHSKDDEKECDYITSKVNTKTFGTMHLNEKFIPNFQGLSGAGLWKIVDHQPYLVGIAIAQDLTENKTPNEGLLYFHGPQSISKMLDSTFKKR